MIERWTRSAIQLCSFEKSGSEKVGCIIFLESVARIRAIVLAARLKPTAGLRRLGVQKLCEAPGLCGDAEQREDTQHAHNSHVVTAKLLLATHGFFSLRCEGTGLLDTREGDLSTTWGSTGDLPFDAFDGGHLKQRTCC